MSKPHIVVRNYRGMRKWYCHTTRSAAESNASGGPDSQVGSGYTPSAAYEKWYRAAHPQAPIPACMHGTVLCWPIKNHLRP